jgi:hypothetical protein
VSEATAARLLADAEARAASGVELEIHRFAAT